MFYLLNPGAIFKLSTPVNFAYTVNKVGTLTLKVNRLKKNLRSMFSRNITSLETVMPLPWLIYSI